MLHTGITALHCTALHCIALHCTPLQWIALHCTALHFIHCTTLHCIALHWTVLHYTAVHCIVLYKYVLHYMYCTLHTTHYYKTRTSEDYGPFVLAPGITDLGSVFNGLHYCQELSPWKVWFYIHDAHPKRRACPRSNLSIADMINWLQSLTM